MNLTEVDRTSHIYLPVGILQFVVFLSRHATEEGCIYFWTVRTWQPSCQCQATRPWRYLVPYEVGYKGLCSCSTPTGGYRSHVRPAAACWISKSTTRAASIHHQRCLPWSSWWKTRVVTGKFRTREFLVTFFPSTSSVVRPYGPRIGGAASEVIGFHERR